MVFAVRRALRRRPTTLTIDLEGLTFLDLTGARALIHSRRLAEAAHTAFALVRPSASSLTTLELSGLIAVFDVR